MSWSTSELRVRLAPLNRFKPSRKIFYWPFQGGTFFVDLLCFCSVLCLLCFVRVCLNVLCGHLLGKGWPLGSRLWCLLWVCHFPIGILGQVWYLIVLIPDLCTLTYFDTVTCAEKYEGFCTLSHGIWLIVTKVMNDSTGSGNLWTPSCWPCGWPPWTLVPIFGVSVSKRLKWKVWVLVNSSQMNTTTQQAFRFMVGPGHCPMISKYGPSLSKAVGPVDPSL